MARDTGGSAKDSAEVLIVALGAMLGIPGYTEKMRQVQRRETERDLIAPARAYRAAHPDAKPYTYGPDAQAYLNKVRSHPASSHGLALALLEDLITAPTTAGGDAEKKLLGRIADLEGRLAHAEHSRDVEARNAMRLVEKLDEAWDETRRQQRARLIAANRAADLQEKVDRLDADLIEANGRLRTAEEQLAAESERADRHIRRADHQES